MHTNTNGLVAQEWNDDNVCNNSTFMLSLKSPNYSYTIHNDLIHPHNLLIDKNSHVAATNMFLRDYVEVMLVVQC